MGDHAQELTSQSLQFRLSADALGDVAGNRDVGHRIGVLVQDERVVLLRPDHGSVLADSPQEQRPALERLR